MKAIFYHNETQQRLAEKSLKRIRREKLTPVLTKVLPATRFYRAEDYHQKYTLRHDKELARAIQGLYKTSRELTDSTLTARLNGFAGGHGSVAAIREEMARQHLAPKRVKAILKAIKEE